jgi:hypothetical protein
LDGSKDGVDRRHLLKLRRVSIDAHTKSLDLCRDGTGKEGRSDVLKIGAFAHSILSTNGAAPAPAGNGVVVGNTTYAVTVNTGSSYIEVQQSSP